MDAIEFVKERQRMCKSFGTRCTVCPAFNICEGLCCAVDIESTLDATAQVAIVEGWSATHIHKTRQSEFLKQWPNVKMSRTEPVISILPCLIDQTVRVEYPCSKDCDDCLREFWMQEIE